MKTHVYVDSDLFEPIRVVRHELGLPVGVICPHARPNHELASTATFFRHIRSGALRACQFPPSLSDAHGMFHKPATW